MLCDDQYCLSVIKIFFLHKFVFRTNLELGPRGLEGVGFVRGTAGFESMKALKFKSEL